MRFDYLLIGFLMISLFTIGGSMIISDMNTNYGFVGVNMSLDSYNNSFNKTNEIYDIAQENYNQTFKADIDGGSNAIDSMIRGAYSAIRMVKNTFGIAISMLFSVASILGVPSFITNIVVSIFMIIVVFSLIYMLFRYVSN